MTRKGAGSRRSDIPVRYIRSDPAGNRESRRIAAREAKRAAKGRDIGGPTGAAPIRQPRPRKDQP